MASYCGEVGYSIVNIVNTHTNKEQVNRLVVSHSYSTGSGEAIVKGCM